MKMRTKQPSDNKYYIRTSSGGWNGAVKGKPTIKDANVLCNCVGYANGRFAEIIDKNKIQYQLVCNAENFIEKAKAYGLKISSVPVLGGIMVWQRGNTLDGKDGAGHVAVVEKIISNNEIITSESGYNAYAFKNVTRKNDNGRWGMSDNYKFRACIVNPAIGMVKAPAETKPSTSKKKSVDEIAKEVLAGKWGNGLVRKKRLTEAGYDYDAVQKRVTELSATKYKVVSKSGMFVRKTANTGAKVVGSLPYGATFSSSKKSGDWVYADNKKGWVCIKQGNEVYLKKV